MFELAITIQSETRYLVFLRQLVRSIAKHVGIRLFPRRAQQAVSLALIEAVDNAIFHAHRRQARMPIDIVIAVDESRVRVDVGDRGKGVELDTPEPPDALATHGRGLFLIKSMVDHVESVKKKGIHWMRMTYEL